MTTKLESQTIKLQKELSKKIISKNCLPNKIKTICGVDVSYSDNRAFCSAIVVDFDTMDIIESARISEKISYPYIPSLFMLRESKPILDALKKLKTDFDILLIDGHGRLHPRLCGLACYVGIKMNKPTIGVAKKILCGTVKADSTIEYNGKILGFEIKNYNKKIYVSVGHRIRLKTAVRIIKKLILDKKWYPEPLRIADSDSKAFRKQSLNDRKNKIHLSKF